MWFTKEQQTNGYKQSIYLSCRLLRYNKHNCFQVRHIGNKNKTINKLQVQYYRCMKMLNIIFILKTIEIKIEINK